MRQLLESWVAEMHVLMSPVNGFAIAIFPSIIEQQTHLIHHGRMQRLLIVHLQPEEYQHSALARW